MSVGNREQDMIVVTPHREYSHTSFAMSEHSRLSKGKEQNLFLFRTTNIVSTSYD